MRNCLSATGQEKLNSTNSHEWAWKIFPSNPIKNTKPAKPHSGYWLTEVRASLKQPKFGIICYDAAVLSFISQFSAAQLLSPVWLFETPWIAARQASLSTTNSWSLLKLMCIESVMPSSHLILCHPLLLLPPIPPSITVFSIESTLPMRWPKYWSFSFTISPSNENPRLIPPLGWTDWISLQSKGLSRVFSNTKV